MVLSRDLTLELPFTLTHPKPIKPVISQMVTLPYKSPASKGSKDGTGGKKGEGEGEEGATGGGAEGEAEPKFNGDECKQVHIYMRKRQGKNTHPCRAVSHFQSKN